MLLQAGARAIVAGAGGPLAGALRSIGGEFLPMPNDTFNPLRIHFNARRLSNLIASERIDIVHAHSAGAAWSAIAATRRMPVFLVTSFPDRLPADFWPGSLYRASLSRGDRVIAPSAYVSRAMIERYKIAGAPASAQFRAQWTRPPSIRRRWPSTASRRCAGRGEFSPQTRVVLVAGRITPRNGQLSMIEAARLLVGGGYRDIAFVFAGEERNEARHVRGLRRQARHARHRHVLPLCRQLRRHAGRARSRRRRGGAGAGPLLSGRAAAQAQAMGRPVVASAVGVLPENVLCPPRMRDELRTGWLVRPGDAGELARAVASALALDVTAYQALSARARQFAEFALSPQSVAEAMRGVYTSLLARDY